MQSSPRWRLAISRCLVVLAILWAWPVQAQNLVGGVTTSAWPTVGSFDTGTGTCSATLIGCQTLVTAAHCICEPGGTAGACPDGTFILDPADYSVFLPHAGEFFVRDVQVAPGYSFGASGDIAVLELDFPVRSVAPEMINTLSSPAFGTLSTIVGYGTLSGTSFDSQILREGDVVTATCVGSGAPNATHLCWSDPASTTCLGDSGGPLFADVGAGLTVAGVHSGGSPLCTPGSPAFDTDVFVESGWVTGAGGADLGFATCGDGPQVGDPSVVEDNFNAVLIDDTDSDDHTVSVSSGIKLLRVALNAEVGSPLNDFDLFVRFGAPASPGSFDCGPQLLNSMEICEFPDPTPGTWHINVDAFAGGPGEYQVTVLQIPANPAPPSFDFGDVIVTDFRAWELMHVDGGTGDRSILSSPLSGTGSQLAAPEGAIPTSDGSALYVANLGQLAVLSVDPATGDRSVVSGCDDLDFDGVTCNGTVTGAGLDFFGPRFVSLENGPSPNLLVSDRSDPGIAAVVSVDPATGARSVVSGCSNSGCGASLGSGPAFDTPFGIAVAADDTIYVADSFGVVAVDPSTGDRTTLTSCTECTGELYVEAGGDIIVAGGRSLSRIDSGTGVRTVISGCTDAGCSSTVGSGPAFAAPLLGVDPLIGGDFLVADGELQALLVVDGSTGDRTIFSGCANAACSSLVGSGTAFTDPLSVVVQNAPEPGMALGLLAGTGTLSLLHRRRNRLQS